MLRNQSTHATGPRRRRTVSAAILATIGLAALAVACSDSPSAPASASARSLAAGTDASRSEAPKPPKPPKTTTTVTGLMWSKPVSEVTVSKVIGPNGGTISIPAGIQVTVPKGAVSDNVTFSVTRLAGRIVAYDFEPHGLTFAVPLLIQQPTLGTNLMKAAPVTNIQGAYFTFLNQGLGTAEVSEFEPTFVSADKAWIRFNVKHFSGYMVSTGVEDQ